MFVYICFEFLWSISTLLCTLISQSPNSQLLPAEAWMMVMFPGNNNHTNNLFYHYIFRVTAIIDSGNILYEVLCKNFSYVLVSLCFIANKKNKTKVRMSCLFQEQLARKQETYWLISSLADCEGKHTGYTGKLWCTKQIWNYRSSSAN